MSWFTSAVGDALGGAVGVVGGVVGGAGVFMFLNRQWTLTLRNNSKVTLVPVGTSVRSGSLNSPLKEIKPGRAEKFEWKKTPMAERGAVGAIHFQIGETDQFFTVFGCIPMNMSYFKSGCNIHIGTYKPSTDDLENGSNGCRAMLEAGQCGQLYGCTYTISYQAEAAFDVVFNYEL